MVFKWCFNCVWFKTPLCGDSPMLAVSKCGKTAICMLKTFGNQSKLIDWLWQFSWFYIFPKDLLPHLFFHPKNSTFRIGNSLTDHSPWQLWAGWSGRCSQEEHQTQWLHCTLGSKCFAWLMSSSSLAYGHHTSGTLSHMDLEKGFTPLGCKNILVWNAI